jgi:hypothetical protein
MVTDDGTETYETADDGTVWITDDGTYDGTSDHETITADGDDPISITAELGNDETHETGTTTGDEKLDGTTTDDGMKTNDEVGTVVIVDLGTDKTTDDGTDDGTFEDSTIATPFVDKIMTWFDGNDETADVGTTTIEPELHADGIVTDGGTEMYETADDGTVNTTLDGTLDGTADHETITADGDVPIGINWLLGNDETNE